MKKLEDLIEEMRRNPDSLGTVFKNPLTFQEEFLLNSIERSLREKVNALLDLALAGSAEMDLSAEQRSQVFELSRLQKSILRLLVERGSLAHGRDCPN